MEKLGDIIVPTTVKGLEIAPTNNDLVEADAVLTSKVGREKRLQKKVKGLEGYDYVIIHILKTKWQYGLPGPR